MAVILYAANTGYLRGMPLNKIGDFESAVLTYMNSEHADLMKQLNTKGDWNDDLEASMKAALDKFIETQTY
jgi:F-type H+/Na+-transporting ATPase subunit alpha